jgi:hypothetical protein
MAIALEEFDYSECYFFFTAFKGILFQKWRSEGELFDSKANRNNFLTLLWHDRNISFHVFL